MTLLNGLDDFQASCRTRSGHAWRAAFSSRHLEAQHHTDGHRDLTPDTRISLGRSSTPLRHVDAVERRPARHPIRDRPEVFTDNMNRVGPVHMCPNRGETGHHRPWRAHDAGRRHRAVAAIGTTTIATLQVAPASAEPQH